MINFISICAPVVLLKSILFDNICLKYYFDIQFNPSLRSTEKCCGWGTWMAEEPSGEKGISRI